MPNHPGVSFIITNHNGLRFKILNPCIESLLQLNYPDYEVIVVDNNSNDGSVEHLRRYKDRVKVIETHRNLYTDGLNQGARAASGKYLVFLNNDTVIHKEYAATFVKAMEDNADIGLSQGLLLCEPNRDTIDNAGDFMDRYGNPFTRGRGEKNIDDYDRVEDILSASGSAFIIRRDVFDKVGAFSPLYHIGYEDMDLALRVWIAGYRVCFIPNAIVYHRRAVTDDSPELRMLVRHHFNKNRLMTIIRNYETTNLIRALPAAVAFILMAATFEAVVGKKPKWASKRITGIMWCIRNLRTILSDRKGIQRNVRKTDDVFIKYMSKTRASVRSFISSR